MSIKIELDEQQTYNIVTTIHNNFPNKKLDDLFDEIIKDALSRLIFPSVENEVRNILTESAEQQAIVMFKKNLHNLLMQPPIV
ncbi:MAG: hypothetical protein ACOZBL_03770 [Patescibacteria group bacterium]